MDYMTDMTDARRSTTGYTPLFYIVFIVLQITLMPFRFEIPEGIHFTWHFYISGLVTNIFMFGPIGFLYRLARGGGVGAAGWRRYYHMLCLEEFIIGLCLSLAIEVTQGFMPGRVTSGFDVVANGFGAWFGAVVLQWVGRRIKVAQVAGLFALELPLMNLVYLLIPLIWLNGLAVGRKPLRLVLLGILGLLGAYLLFAIYYHGFYKKGKLGVNLFCLLVTAWFFVSSVPALLRFPYQVSAIGLGIGAALRLRFLFPVHVGGDSRRYEIPTLKRLFPFFLAYLLVLLAWPTTLDLVTLQAVYITGGKAKMFLIFGFLERFAAYTLLGYMTAELRGRKQEGVWKTLGVVLGAALIGVVCGVLLRGYRTFGYLFQFAGLLETVLMGAAALYGGLIYRLQLRAIRDLFHPPGPG